MNDIELCTDERRIVSVVGGIGINVKAYSLSTVLEGYVSSFSACFQ